jgi:starch synthase (maltosyl-transferring)
MQEGLRIYNLFPLLAGTVAGWRTHLPRIAAMDFNAVYVNPFHAPGFSGSLYAVKDFYALNPLFRDRGAQSDDELLAGFTAACAERRLLPMMDLVINHTAKDSPLVARHPRWFARAVDGTVRSPSAIDPADATQVTVWGDLAEIAYDGPEEDAVIAYFCGVARHYAALGFRGFRCDAAYKVPARAWRRIIAAAREAAPKAVFCAETLGARIDEVKGLAGAGFDYLFNSSKWWDFSSPWLLDQYDQFRRIAPSIAFPESHDTTRLASDLAASGITDATTVAAHYRQAYAFAACFSAGVMMPMGYEFGWAQRLDVKATRPEPAEPQRFDLSPFIRAVNAMKRDTPALNVEAPQRLLTAPGASLAALARGTADDRGWAFVLVNRDESAAATVEADRLLAAARPSILLDDVTPADAGRAALALDLQVPPLGFRVLRGRLGERLGAAHEPVCPQPAPVRDDSQGARILIEDVYPELDCGLYPVKRVVGDRLDVWADIFRDGHDAIAASVLYRPERSDEWAEAPMRFDDNDRWVGSVPLVATGRMRYTIEAWTDAFASWRADAIKKRDAGQSLALELVEGRALVAATVARAGGEDARLLGSLFAAYDARDEAQRARLLLSRLLAGVMARWDERASATRYRRELAVVVDRPLARFGAWYEMFPRSQGKEPGRSATFDDCIARLPAIAAMGFNVIYLPPIHPIGRINRKGRDNSLAAGPGDPGSPYAIGSAEGGHRAVHRELGGIEGFRRFVAAAREAGLEIALDFAVQCAPDHPWVSEHPEWFVFRPDGTIKFAENPPKKYQDIVNPDFYNRDRERLWTELRDVILHWIGEGVTIFRVDNPHTKPVPFWEWLIREVQDRHPGTIFLAEAFTRPKMLRALAKAGFTQSYSYFTWRTHKRELTDYLVELAQGPSKEYLRPNFFTNTPDILPEFLQQGGRPAFLIRLVLAATLAATYGIYNGFELCEAAAVPGTEEYLHSEKYEFKVWDWYRPGHIKDEIARINRIRRDNPALHHLSNLCFHHATDEHVLFYGKESADHGNFILVAVNLDPFAAHESELHLPLGELGIAADQTFVATDLLTGAEQRWKGSTHRIRLDPAIMPAAIFRVER